MLLELICIFNHKKKYINYLCQQNVSLHKEIREINSNSYANNKVKDNLFKIISKEEIILNVYERSNNLYAVSCKLENNYLCDKEYSLVIYEITSNDLIAVCKANAEIKNNKMELVTLDTTREQRCGHASKMVKFLIDLAKVNNLVSIYGDLMLHTSIGLENLISFYKKNGFIISNNKFKMMLNES